MRDHEDRNQNGRDDHLSENQRIGKRLAQEDRYRNQNQSYSASEGRPHYGNDPNSAYRNPNINYGDNREHRDAYPMGREHPRDNRNNRPDDRFNPDNRYRENRSNGDDRYQDRFNNDQRRWNNGPREDRYRDNRPPQNDRNHNENRYTQSDNQFYQGEEPRLFDDRKQFEAEDYRYGSGNRPWQPGDEHPNRNDLDDRRRYQDREHRDRDEKGFFGRLADDIRDDWRTFTGANEHDDGRRQRPEPRNFDRGRESGSRWADEDDARYRDHNQRRGRRPDDDQNRW